MLPINYLEFTAIVRTSERDVAIAKITKQLLKFWGLQKLPQHLSIAVNLKGSIEAVNRWNVIVWQTEITI